MNTLNYTDTTLAQASQHLNEKGARRTMFIIAFTVTTLAVLFLTLPMIA